MPRSRSISAIRTGVSRCGPAVGPHDLEEPVVRAIRMPGRPVVQQLSAGAELRGVYNVMNTSYLSRVITDPALIDGETL
jgi:hypothetical protein